MVDMVVPRAALKSTVSHLLGHMMNGATD
jgi:acetyl-CoA carboxylase beta subunit